MAHSRSAIAAAPALPGLSSSVTQVGRALPLEARAAGRSTARADAMTTVATPLIGDSGPVIGPFAGTIASQSIVQVEVHDDRSRMAHRRNLKSKATRKSPGFTLVEAMVALLVLSVGVIGVAALHGQSLAASRAAIFRSQAIGFAGDMAERIRLNRGARSAYAGDARHYACDAPSDRGGVACPPPELAAYDLFVWNQEIAAALPGGQGSVIVDTNLDPATYTVSVSWDEATESDRASFPLTFRLAVD
jgi:type IV pilus assembly protein PilV